MLIYSSYLLPVPPAPFFLLDLQARNFIPVSLIQLLPRQAPSSASVFSAAARCGDRRLSEERCLQPGRPVLRAKTAQPPAASRDLPGHLRLPVKRWVERTTAYRRPYSISNLYGPIAHGRSDLHLLPPPRPGPPPHARRGHCARATPPRDRACSEPPGTERKRRRSHARRCACAGRGGCAHPSAAAALRGWQCACAERGAEV